MSEKQIVRKSGWCSVDVIARLLNLSARRVQQLAKEGHIPQGRRGMYEFVPAVQGYARYLQNLVAAKDNIVSAHTAEVLKQRAEKLKRENDMAAGEFIPRRDVIVGMRMATDYIRKTMLAIPAKAAPAALAAKSVAGVKLVLQEHVYEALDELSRTRVVPVGEDETAAPKKPRRREPPK